MALTIFDWLKQVTYIKDPWSSFSDEDKATFNPYMLHRFISMHEPYIELANYLQQFWQLTHEQIYLIYCEYLPENKIFAKYIKSTTPKANSDLVAVIADHYKVSTREAKTYINMLSEDTIKSILSSRGINDDEIKKLFKNEKTTKTSKAST
jgi:hypothetical protein